MIFDYAINRNLLFASSVLVTTTILTVFLSVLAALDLLYVATAQLSVCQHSLVQT